VDDAIAAIKKATQECTFKTLEKKVPSQALIKELRQMRNEVLSTQGVGADDDSSDDGSVDGSVDSGGAVSSSSSSQLSVTIFAPEATLTTAQLPPFVKVTLVCMSPDNQAALEAAYSSFKELMDTFGVAEFSIHKNFPKSQVDRVAATSALQERLGDSKSTREFASSMGLTGAVWHRSRLVVELTGDSQARKAGLSVLADISAGAQIHTVLKSISSMHTDTISLHI
jgi:hypothetical protein